MNCNNMASAGCNERGSFRRASENSSEEMRKMFIDMYDRILIVEYLVKLANHNVKDDDSCRNRIEMDGMTIAALDAASRYASELSSEIAAFV
jgi:hypothetical protein